MGESNNDKTEKPEYTAEMITVLTAREAVRKRPAMYIGSVGELGLHNLVRLLIDNSINEFIAGFGDNIGVTLQPANVVTVIDHGRGLPVWFAIEEKKSIAELLLTEFFADHKYLPGNRKVTTNPYLIELNCVNALSEWLTVTIKREGHMYEQSYERGIPKTPLRQLGKTDETGNIFTFKPDSEIFTITEFNTVKLAEILQRTAFLNKGIRITLVDERTDKKHQLVFQSSEGITDFVKLLNKNHPVIHQQPIHLEKPLGADNLAIEVALQYNGTDSEQVWSFANQICTDCGGEHLAGFRAALTRSLNQFAKSKGLIKSGLSGAVLRQGLTAIISVALPYPSFTGATRRKLASEIRGPVESFIYRGLCDYFEQHTKVTQAIIRHVTKRANNDLVYKEQ